MSLTNLPLTPGQKLTASGILLPSGESSYYDFSQDYSYHDGSGINVLYPSPYFVSGLLATLPPSGGNTTGGTNGVGSGNIFNYGGLTGLFSNAEASLVSGINDFTIFNAYIHYYTIPTITVTGAANQTVFIPYISDYTVVPPFNIYDQQNYQYYDYSNVFGV